MRARTRRSASHAPPAASSHALSRQYAQLRQYGLNLLAAVGRAGTGGDRLPRLVTIEYRGDPANADDKVRLPRHRRLTHAHWLTTPPHSR